MNIIDNKRHQEQLRLVLWALDFVIWAGLPIIILAALLLAASTIADIDTFFYTQLKGMQVGITIIRLLLYGACLAGWLFLTISVYRRLTRIKAAVAAGMESISNLSTTMQNLSVQKDELMIRQKENEENLSKIEELIEKIKILEQAVITSGENREIHFSENEKKSLSRKETISNNVGIYDLNEQVFSEQTDSSNKGVLPSAESDNAMGELTSLPSTDQSRMEIVIGSKENASEQENLETELLVLETKNKMKLILDLELGFNDAENYKRRENKQFLNDVFIRNEYLDKLCGPAISFLVGEKGTGKTAYAVYLSNNNYRAPRKITY